MSLRAAIQQAKNIERVSKARREATHCKRGHNDWGWVTKEDGKKRRYCITCKRERQRVGKPVLGPFGLRDEEIAVLQVAADGLSVKEASQRLHYCKASISDQRARAMSKLNTHSMVHAVAIALRHGVIS